MDENIALFFLLDKPIAFFVTEPLYDTIWHGQNLPV
jgi:hypothetical protein